MKDESSERYANGDWLPGSADLDLGEDHLLFFVGWSPDRSLNSHLAHLPDVEKYCAVITHKNSDGDRCIAAITFDSEVSRAAEPRKQSKWTVESWEPLTVSPSILCSCGDHGFIRAGKWVRA